MRTHLIRRIAKILILFILVGMFPSSGNTAFASSDPDKTEKTKKSKKKKKPKKSSKKKKKSTKKKRKPKKRKKSSSKKKRRPKKKTKKKRPSKKQRISKKKKRPAKESSIVHSPREDIKAIDFAGELFNLTESLNTSSRELARATRYLNPVHQQKAVRIESKPLMTVRDLEKVADRNPDDLRLQRELALHYESGYEWEKAKDIYFRLIVKNPQNPDAHYFLGSLYNSTGEMVKSQQAFEEAMDLKPDHKATLEALTILGQSPEKKKVTEQVLLRSSIKDPDGPAQQLAEIQKRIDDGLFQDAIRLSKDAIEKYPQNGGFIYLHGKVHEEIGDIDKAKSAYQKAILIDVKNQDAYTALANVYFEQGKYIYAALTYTDVIRLKPGNIDGRYMQGLSYYRANEWGRAASAWEDLLHYQPNHPMVLNLLPQTYYVLAVEYNRTGQSALGRTSFDKAISINSNSFEWLPSAMRTLGRHYRDKAMYKESLSAYQEVIELRPKDSSAYVGIGITYWKMGESQLAKAAWERSLELNSDNNEAKGWLILTAQES